ncbi:MAG: choice-of-anchor tandem repeat GloVer-containing protein [Candidatus Sulfotelmatobacter sp.]
MKFICSRSLLSMILTLMAALLASAILVSQSEAQAESVLYRFQGGSDGSGPAAGLIADSAGNFYGTTTYGGGSPQCLFITTVIGCGTVFELFPNSSGVWTETVLYRFQGGSDGAEPFAGLVMDSKRNLYGTTGYGGSDQCSGGCGTVFKLTAPISSGGAWTESLLYSFQGGSDGQGPRGGVMFDQAGNLYGTTASGGGSLNCPYNSSCGTIFQLAPPPTSDGAWTETVLYRFNAGAGGALPHAGLVFDKKGNLYGTTYFGGLGPSGGIVFRAIPPATSGAWTVKVLHAFARGSDGGTPVAGVILDAKGNVYGTTVFGGGGRCLTGGQGGCGTVFELSPPATQGGAWHEEQIAAFPAGRDGRAPEGGLTFDGNGNLYGTTSLGGNGHWGSVFRLTPPAGQGGSWNRTVLYYFQGGSDGSDPQADLLLLNGALYGTTNGGDATCSSDNGQSCGTVFKVVP